MIFARASEFKANRLKIPAADTEVDFTATVSESQSVTAPPMIEISEDSQLVNAARDGNRAAFGELYGKYARVVHGILLARIPAADVDDLLQDIFLHAMGKLPSLRDADKFAAWLCAIARNRATDFHRRSREFVDLPEEVAQENAPAEEAHEILAVIRDLPDAYRETLILRLVEGLTGPEIAARTGLTPGSVRVNLHRGMQQLREKLGPRHGETP